MPQSNQSFITASRADNTAAILGMACATQDPKRRAQMIAHAQAQIAWTLRSAVDECIAAGISWAKIAEALDMPRETVFRQHQAGSPIDTMRAMQSSASPNRAHPRNQYSAKAIYSFQTPDGMWWGRPELLPEGEFETAALPMGPVENGAARFADQVLMVRFGRLSEQEGISFNAAKVVDSHGSERLIRMTHDTMDTLFGDAQTPLRRAMTAVVHAVLFNPRNPEPLREAVSKAASAQLPSRPISEFVSAIKEVIATAQVEEPTEIFAHRAIERLKAVLAEFEAWMGGAQ